jgi:nucleotide-binding universal stress UspA family protein
MNSSMNGKGGPRSIVVAGIDFSGVSRLVIQAALKLATIDAGELHLVHILPTPANQIAGGSRADRRLQSADPIDQARQAMGRLVAELGPSTIRIVGHLRVGKPDEEIAQLASDLGADLIVVGTHGQTGMERLVLGSVAESLVKHAPCPVLAFRPKLSTAWDKIEPPCPDCLQVQATTKRAQLWCERHSEHHPRAHTYSEIPESYGIGAQTFR